MNIDQALEQCKKEWIGKPGIVGIGKGEKENKECVVIMVSDTTVSIPKHIENIDIDVRHTGEFDAQ